MAWLVSARSAAGLAGQAARLAAWAAARPELAAADVAWSLATTRSMFEHRAVVTGADREELMAGLARAGGRAAAPAGWCRGRCRRAARARVGFLFSGQGSQRAGMAAGLHAASPVFAAVFDAAAGLLEELLGVPVAEVALGAGPDGADDARADQTLFAQPGLFAVQAGLVAVLAACGITPGRGGGALGGRGRGRVRGGGAVPGGRVRAGGGAGAADAGAAGGRRDVRDRRAGRRPRRLADGGLAAGAGIAAVNGPAAVVVSGDEDAVRQVAAVFAGAGRRTRMLRVSHAFHSAADGPGAGRAGPGGGPGLGHAAPRVAVGWCAGGGAGHQPGPGVLGGGGAARRSGSPTP